MVMTLQEHEHNFILSYTAHNRREIETIEFILYKGRVQIQQNSLINHNNKKNSLSNKNLKKKQNTCCCSSFSWLAGGKLGLRLQQQKYTVKNQQNRKRMEKKK